MAKGFFKPNFPKLLIFGAGVITGLTRSVEKYTLLMVGASIMLVIVSDLVQAKREQKDGLAKVS